MKQLNKLLTLLVLTLFVNLLNAQNTDYQQSLQEYRNQNYEKADLLVNNAIVYFKNKNLTDSIAMAYLHKADIAWVAEGNYQALEVIDIAISYSNELTGKNLAKVAVYNKKGQILVNISRFREGIIYLQKALEYIPPDKANSSIVAKLYTDLSWYYLTQDDFNPAMQYARQSLNIQEEIFGKDARQLMGALQSISLIAHGAGDFKVAEEYALELLRIASMHLEKTHPTMGLVHNGLGTIYESSQQYEKALYHFGEMMRIMQADYQLHGNPQMSAIAYNNTAMLYESIGEYTLAESYSEKGLELNKLNYGERGAGIIRPLADLADIKRNLRKYDQADSLYRLAYTIQEEIDEKDGIQLAYVESQYGDLFFDKKEYDKAEELYQRAIKNYRQKSSENTEILQSTLSTLGAVWANKGQTKKAIDMHHSVLDTYRKLHSKGNIRIAGQLNKISEAYMLNENYKDAMKYSDSVFLELLKVKEFPEGNWLLKLPFHHNVINYFNNRIVILNKLHSESGNKKYLIEIIGIADNYNPYLEKGIPAMRTQSSLIQLGEKNEFLYQCAINACWDIYELENNQNYLIKAFEYSERAKALVLLLAANNVLVDANTESSKNTDTDKYWRERISSLNTRYLNSGNSDDSLLTLLTHSIESYRFFQDSLLKIKDPLALQKYYIQPYTIDDIRKQLLSNKETLLEFKITDSHVYQFVVTKDKFAAFRWPVSILKDVEMLKNPYQLTIEKFIDPSYKLFSYFIEPLKKEYIRSDKLLIIPDKTLYELNFELLVSSKKGKNFKEPDYLIKEKEITYLLSATSAIRLKGSTARTNKKALLYAPVFSDKMKSDYRESVKGNLLEDKFYYQLLRQPFSLQAAMSIVNFIQGDLYTGQDAQEKRFKLSAGDYRILHLGTHAEANNEDPLQSRLIMAKPLGNDPDDYSDGYLHAFEIYGMQLKAELAVLSACETGSGAFMDGEGVMSLAHSFMHAGCPSVVMSLWKIDEKSSAEIISVFYKYLADGYSSGEALRKSKLRYLKNSSGELSHPYYWGGLALMGSSKAVYTNYYWLHWILGLTGIGILGIIIWKKYFR